MKRPYIHTILVSFLLVSCAGLPANAQAEEPFFHITTTNLDDQVKIQSTDDMVVIDVTSPSGIGSATLELESGSMPEEIAVQLHLQGLEEFRLRSAQDSIAASVSSHAAADIHQKIITSAGDSSLDPNDPLWLKIEIVAGQAGQEIPLKEGYFEITLPKDFLREAGSSFEIEWVDFYR